MEEEQRNYLEEAKEPTTSHSDISSLINDIVTDILDSRDMPSDFKQNSSPVSAQQSEDNIPKICPSSFACGTEKESSEMINNLDDSQAAFNISKTTHEIIESSTTPAQAEGIASGEGEEVSVTDSSTSPAQAEGIASGEGEEVSVTDSSTSPAQAEGIASGEGEEVSVTDSSTRPAQAEGIASGEGEEMSVTDSSTSPAQAEGIASGEGEEVSVTDSSTSPAQAEDIASDEAIEIGKHNIDQSILIHKSLEPTTTSRLKSQFKPVLKPKMKPPRKRPQKDGYVLRNKEEKFLVRGVEILSFDILDNIVHFKVEVTATERRHWIVVKRYSDFSMLEQLTWQLRGPMPPFPHAWEGIQILLHLMEPVIQRKRRLETKKKMLQDWLERLVHRARHSKQLQHHVNAFLKTRDEFEGANSRLLLSANNVTSLVVTNPDSNVESILLKLSTNVERMSTAKGKQTLNRARLGPCQDIASTPLDLDTLPSTLEFNLSQKVPTLRLALSHKSPKARAFKVMATEPTRYFVHPAQCVVLPGSNPTIVSIFMPDGFELSESFIDGQDRFLFVSYELDESWLEAYKKRKIMSNNKLSKENKQVKLSGNSGSGSSSVGMAYDTSSSSPSSTAFVWQSFANENLIKKKLSVKFSNRPPRNKGKSLSTSSFRSALRTSRSRKLSPSPARSLPKGSPRATRRIESASLSHEKAWASVADLYENATKNTEKKNDTYSIVPKQGRSKSFTQTRSNLSPRASSSSTIILPFSEFPSNSNDPSSATTSENLKKKRIKKLNLDLEP